MAGQNPGKRLSEIRKFECIALYSAEMPIYTGQSNGRRRSVWLNKYLYSKA